MIWRTDKPTEKVIVAKLTEDFCHIKDNYSLLYLADKPYQHYCEYGEEIPYSAIEKWASLEDELPEGLEEAAMRDSLDYVDSIPDGGTDKHPWNDHDAEKAYYDGMLAGAEWQKEKDTRDMFMSDNRHFNKVYELGKKDMKQEMMEKAVSGRYMKADGKVYVESWPLDIDPNSVKAGDEVRIIVIPDEG